MAIIGSFNGFFKNNTGIEDKMNSRFGKDSYNVYVSSVNDVFENMDKGIKLDFFETANMKNAQSVKTRLNEAIDLRNAMKNGEKIISYDLETLGSLTSNNGNFAITEYAAMMKDYGNNTVSPLIDLNMGITEDIKKKLLKDVTSGLDSELSESAKVTLERLPYISKDNLDLSNIEMSKSNVNRALNDLTKKKIRYGDKEAVKNELLKISDNISPLKNNITIGYNIKNFDNIARQSMMELHGLESNLLSTGREIDIQELFMNAFDTSIHDMYEKKGMGNINGKFKVENLAKLFGVDTGTSHVAADDTMTVFNILEASFDGGDTTVLDKVIENIESKTKSANYVKNTSSSNILYKSINSNNTVENYNFNKGADKHGTISKDGYQKHIDFMVDNYSNKPMTYRDRSSSRNIFYEAGEMRVIPREYLSDDTKKAIGKEANEAYVLPMMTYGDSEFGHTSYIIRGSKEEIEDVVSSNYKSYNVVNNIKKGDINSITREAALAQEEIYYNDLARRNFDGMFESGSQKDFNYAKNMYSTYSELNEAYSEFGGNGKLNSNQISELVSNGKLKVGENELSLLEHAQSLRRNIPDELNKGKYIKGDIVTEWARDFKHMYGFLDDTADVIEPLISNIDSKVNFANKDVREIMKYTNKENRGAVLNRIKKDTLSNSYSDLINGIKDVSDIDGDLFDEVMNNYDINYYNYADILDGDKYSAINISTRDTAIDSLRKRVNKNSRMASNSATKKNIALSNLISISENLNERGIIDSSLLSGIYESGDVNASTKAVASQLFDYAQIAKGNTPEEEQALSYIRLMLNGDDENIKMLGNLRSGMPTTRDMSHYNIGKQSFRDFVMGNSKQIMNSIGTDDLVDGLVDSNLNKSLNIFNFSANEKFLNYYSTQKTTEDKLSALPKKFVSYLRSNVGYNDKEIASVGDMLYGYRGPEYYKEVYGYTDEQIKNITNRGNGYVSRGYATTFVSGDKKGDLKHGFLIYNPEDTVDVINAYNRGEISSKAAFQPIPTITEDYGTRYIKQGNSNKMITEEVSAYYPSYSIGVDNAVLREGNTITEAIDTHRIIRERFDNLMSTGNVEEATALLNNQYNKVIGNEIGTSAYRRIGGKKQFVANINDIVGYKKASGLMAYLPNLYEGNKEIRDEMNELFGEDVLKNEFNKIRKNVKNYSLNKHQARGDIHEWYLKNLFDGRNLSEKMTKLDTISSNSVNIINNVRNEVSKGSMLVKEGMVGKYNFIFSKDNFVEFDAFSEYDNPLRPLHNQRLGTKAILYNEFTENAKDRGIDNIQEYLKEKRIYLGGMTRSSKANYKYNYVADSIGKTVYDGLSVKAVQMPSEVYYEMVNSLDSKELTKEFMKTNKAITQDDVDYILRAYQNNGATYEQHSILRPSIGNYASPNRETVSVKLQGIDPNSFNIGDDINNKTTIGLLNIDNKLEQIKYKNVAGKIIDIDKSSNTLQIEPLNKAFNEIKFNIGNEKTVSTPILGKTQTQYEASELIFDKLFGKDVSLAANMEFGKHKSAGSLLQGRFDSIVETLNLHGSENDFELFRNSINQSGLGWNLKFEKDAKTGLRYAIKNTSKVNGNAFEMLDNSLDSFYKRSGNTKLINSIKTELTNNEKNNTYRTTLKFAELNESLQASTDELGRGIKDTPRKRQVFGSTILPGYRTLDSYDELNKIVQPILDMNIEKIQSSSTFSKAYTDMGNLYNTSRAISGETENIKILNKNLLELDVNNKNLTVDLMHRNLYGLDADEFGVLKLNLKNQKVTNPITKVKEDFVYLPILHTNVIDDVQIYPSKSQESITELVRMLSLKENMSSLEGTKFENQAILSEEIDKAYTKAYNMLGYEYSNKNGMMNQAISSGRVDLSGMSLTSGIIPPDFIDAEKTKLRSKMGNDAIRLVNGKPVYDDIVWTSKDYLKSMGYDSKAVGRQLYRNDFLDNQTFKKIIEENGLLKSNVKIDDDIFEQIGDLYAKKIGIDTVITREPTFHAGASRAARTRLDDTMSGYSVVIPSWIAGPQNADIDGDNEFLQLVGLKKTKNGAILRGNNDNITKSINKLLELQTDLNANYVNGTSPKVELDYDENGKFTGKYRYRDESDSLKFTTSPKVMTEIMDNEFEMKGNTNFFSDEYKSKFNQLGVKVRQNKSGIGYISNENFKIREMAFTGLDKENININKYNNIVDFTTQTEQKIIDVKHSNVEKLTVTNSL